MLDLKFLLTNDWYHSVFNGKAAGAGRAERDAEAVEHGHAAEQKTHNAQRGKQNVDSV